MKYLDKRAYEKAKTYVFTQGRAVDQALFRYHFEGGDPAAVCKALAAYQNEDGGFGHALEPDLRSVHSSAIATSTGLHILRSIDTPADEALVQKAIAYLIETFDEAEQVWPIIPPEVMDAPHAPWWNYENTLENFGGFLVNPRAALVGYLQHYQSLVSPDFLSNLRELVVAHLESETKAIEMHDFFCYLGLAGAQGLPEALRQRMQARLRQAALASVELDPAKWGDYNLKPLEIAGRPDSFLTKEIPKEALDANLDYDLEQQAEDGAWPLSWSWAQVDAAAWAQAERDWRGHLAVNKLLTFKAWGRIGT